MKQLLRLFTLLTVFFVGGTNVFAGDFTFNATDIQNVGNKDAGNTATNGTFTFTAVKNDGSTNPAFNANGGDVRLYAKNTFTITNSAGNMTKIVFTISAQGKRRLTEVTASTGTIATQAAGDETVTWTGNAAEVTFTVGEKAVYGSDGGEKAGQFDFSSLVITADAGEGGSDVTPVDPIPTDLQTVDNIAAFKALADGTEAILKLNNAQVLYASGNDIYVRDNSGAIDFFKTGLELTTGQMLNGSVIGKYTLYNKTPELAKTDNTKADNIKATAGTATAKTLTIAEAKNEANICDLIKITGAKIVSKQEGDYTNLYACVGDDEIMIYDKYKLVEGTADENETYDVEGILIIFKDAYEIYLTKDYTNGEGGEEPPIVDPSEVKVPYSIDFTKGQEPFTINDVVLPEGLNFIWANSSSYGMKASGYYQKAYATESWLISPMFDMTSTTAPVLKFSHTGRYFTDMETEATLWAKVEGGEWEQLSIPTWFTNNDWNFVDAQVDLSKYAGKKITLGFKYTSKEAGAATWEIKTLSIDEVKEPELVIQGEQEFETSTTVTIVPSNPDNEVYYTLDGSDPVSSSTAIQYTKPFTLTQTTTVKAFEEGAELYAEMTFTKKEVQLEEKTIAEINEMTEDTKNVKLVLNNALVTYVDGTNIYLRENGKALMFFKTALPFTVGDVLKGSVIMDYDNYYGIHEMKDNDATSAEGITVVGKETPVPTEVTIPDVITLNHICDYIVLKSVKVVKDGNNYFAVDNAENKVQLYKGLDVSSFADDGKLYDVEGVFNNIYKNAPEVQPIDVTEAVSEGIANIVTNNANAKVYNLAGQRVTDSYKGVVIVNGKKFIVK